MLVTSVISGFLVSLSGSLPLGNLNITALNIAARENMRRAIFFAAGVVCIEMLYLGITLSALDLVLKNKTVFVTLQWTTVVLLLVLAAGNFIASGRQKQEKNRLTGNNIPRFLLGAGMSAVNTLQFPFWAGWAVYLLTRHYIIMTAVSAAFFTAGAGVGTTAALAIFIIAGKRFSDFLQRNNKVVQLITGILFATIAISQILCILH
ncbi:LysE family translocator [Chitinophagaceae bacterium MMS25-I14]